MTLDPELCPKCGGCGRVKSSKKRMGYRHRVHRCRTCEYEWDSYQSRLNIRRAVRELITNRMAREVQKRTR